MALKVAFISCANSKKDLAHRQGLPHRLGAFLGALDTLGRRDVRVLGLSEWGGKHMEEKTKTSIMLLMSHFDWIFAGEATKDDPADRSFAVAVFVRGLSLANCKVMPVTLRVGGKGDVCRAAGFLHVDPDSGKLHKILFVHLTLDFFGGLMWALEAEQLKVLCGPEGSENWGAIGDFNRLVEEFPKRTALLEPAGIVYGASPSDITFAPWATDPVPAECFKDHPELVSKAGQQFSPLDCVVGAGRWGDVRVCLPFPHLPEVGLLPLDNKIKLFEKLMWATEPYQMVSDHFVLVAEALAS
jgi:hypothetical protein